MTMWILLALIAALLVYLVSVYNGLVRLKNQVANGFAQIEVQLKRRHDLIPNLVQAARRYMDHEAQTLTEVIQARNFAEQAAQKAHDASGAHIDGLAQAENRLSAALGRFFAVAESYPDLKADGLIKQLMDEIANTENRIGFARQHYNDSVMFFNNQREVFPNNVVSGFFGFERLEQLQFADAKDFGQAPGVDFS